MKKIIIILMVLMLCGCSNSVAITEPKEIWLATDIHYMSELMHNNTDVFTTLMESSDGKLSEYSDDIFDSFLNTVIENKPDALVLAGDLSFNGENFNLIEIAAKLAVVEEQGIPVLVIPGNHDIEYPYAYVFIDEKVYTTQQITEQEFKELCGDYGYNEAISKDESSFSYVYALSDNLWLMFIDTIQ